MDDPQSIWIIVGVLTFFLAIITASLCAVTLIRFSVLERMSEEGNGSRGGRLLRLLQDDKNRILSGLSMTRFVLALITGALLAHLGILLRWQTPQQVAVAAGISLVSLLVITEIIPRFLASINPEKSAGGLYSLIALIAFFAVPISKAAEKLISPVTAPLNRNGESAIITAEEIRHLVNEGHRKGVLEEEEKEMIQSVFEFTGTIAREVMIPRVDIEAAPSSATLSEVMTQMTESGFSRIPIYEETLDRILGIAYSKDVLPCVKGCNLDIPAIEVARKPPFFVPDTKPVVDLLREMQKRSISIAIVVDEYGGTSGLVTIEDLIEELVGEITDEYDKEEPGIRREEDGAYIVDASMIIEDVNQFMGISVPADEHETIGGFVYGHLGHIPEKDESMTLGDLGIVITVEEMDGQRIDTLRICKQEADPEEKENSGSGNQ